MSKNKKIKWVAPQIVNLEHLPTTLGACGSGSSAINDGGKLQCKTGGIAGGKCKAGSTVLRRKCKAGGTVM